jgi:hypothetical protein
MFIMNLVQFESIGDVSDVMDDSLLKRCLWNLTCIYVGLQCFRLWLNVIDFFLLLLIDGVVVVD